MRGDSWYLVDGTYATKTLSAANSGTTLITIKKATASNYTDITATGWTSSFTNQASLGGLTISSSYWLIDGVTGDGASVVPADTNTIRYGFYFTADNRPVNFSGAISNITVQHARFITTYTPEVAKTAIYSSDSDFADKNTLTISHCLFDLFNEVVRNGNSQWDGAILQYSIILNSEGHSDNDPGTTDTHGNPINAMWAPLVNMTIRYNVFKDMYGNGVSGVISGNNAGIQSLMCYGNVFDNIPHCTYVIGANSGYSITGSRFYNNTVIHCNNDDAGYPICGRITGSNNIGGNNLLYDLISVMYNSAWVGDYDAFYSCSLSSGANKYVSTGNPFVNYAGMDYRLATNTPAGTNAGALFATDALGTTRTTLTRGAFEFGSGGSTSSSGSRLNVNTLIVRR